MADHTPHRPSWDCHACEQPWPCDPAREALIGEMERKPLTIYMWDRFDEAVMELPPSSVVELFERFVKWAG